MSSGNDVSVHVIDDDDEQRSALAGLLRSRGMRVIPHHSAHAFLAFPATRPYCVVTDLRMPGMSGLELQRRLRARGEHVSIVIMTGFADVTLAVEAMRDGAIDVVEKPFEAERILAAVARARAAAQQHGAEECQAGSALRVARLCAREKQVLALLLAGFRSRAIAEQLGLSVRTVEGYRSSMMEKLEADSLPEAIRIGLLAGVPVGQSRQI